MPIIWMGKLRPDEMRNWPRSAQRGSFFTPCFLLCRTAHLVFIGISLLHASVCTSRYIKEIKNMVLTITKWEYHVCHCDCKQLTTIPHLNKYVTIFWRNFFPWKLCLCFQTLASLSFSKYNEKNYLHVHFPSHILSYTLYNKILKNVFSS